MFLVTLRQVDGRIILKCILNIRWADVDWIYLAQNRDEFRILVNTVVNLHVPHYVGVSFN
jgi:hypothetical protein